MFIDTFFKLFLPKDKIFYSLFEQVTNNTHFMANHLKDLVYEQNVEKRTTIAHFIEDLEHKNDEVIHTIFIELGKNFITPFDREDIHYLASSLDKIADYIHATSKKIIFYKVNPNDTGILKLTELIVSSTLQIAIAVSELRNMKDLKKITDALIKINALENQSDDIYDLSIEKLFDSASGDFIEVIKKREIYQVLEKVSDKCEDASKIIESILIKYA